MVQTELVQFGEVHLMVTSTLTLKLSKVNMIFFNRYPLFDRKLKERGI